MLKTEDLQTACLQSDQNMLLYAGSPYNTVISALIHCTEFWFKLPMLLDIWYLI